MKKWLKDIKIIDLIGIGFFFLILFSSVLLLLRQANYVYVTLKIASQDYLHSDEWYQPANWYLANLKEGLEDRDMFGKLNARVEDIYFYKTDKNNQDIFVTLQIEATHNKRTDQYSYQGLPLLIGNYQAIELGGIAVRGMVQNVSQEKPLKNFKPYLVTAKLEAEHNEAFFTNAAIEYHGVKKFVADKIEEGDVYYDSNGNKIVEILEIEKTPSQKTFVSAVSNNLTSFYDAERQNVNLKLLVNTTEVFNGFFLYREEMALNLGQVIPIYLDDLVLQATITDLEEL